MRRASGIRIALATASGLLLWGLPATPVQAALTQTVTITINEIDCATACDGQGIEGIGDGPPDWFARVFMDGGPADPAQLDGPDDTAHLRPNWEFRKTVPATQQNVGVRVQIWDEDTFDDDLADATPQSGDKNLDFNVDVAKGAVTGEVSGGIGQKICTFGNGEDGDGSAYVCFTATTGDRDGDGLQDSWETNGIDFDGNGTVDLPLNAPPFNANPDRKDLYMEVDYMTCAAGGCAPGDAHSHRPAAGALSDVIAAFANAPVPNPVGANGISLHIVEDEAIADTPGILFQSNGPGANDDFNDIKNGNPVGTCTGRFGTAAERASADCANLLAAKRAVFQYVIFGHTYSEGPGSSGISELNSNGGNDLMVTFGGWSAGGIAGAGGQRVADASTLMHEYGHNLGLGHGGFEGKNCKPNYLSLMSYTLQFPNIDNTRPMDFSNATLPVLDETSLPAAGGVGGPAGRNTVFGRAGNSVVAPANGPINWDGSGGTTGDVDFISSINPGCNVASPGDKSIAGWNDWANLVYNFRSSKDFADGASREVPVELTNDAVIAMTPLADLGATKTVDRAVALPGDTLSYQVSANNGGPGKAVGVALKDTLPDGSVQQLPVADLAAGASQSRNLAYVIPCTTTDGTKLTNSVTVSGTNVALVGDPNPADNTAAVTTTVAAPRLVLEKSVASAGVNAGEAISYRLTYANAGSGAANDVVIKDTLPAEMYYSPALDLGSGPQPTSVVGKSDGTTELTWNVGAVAGNAAPVTISYTARTSLLVTGGTAMSNSATISYANANGCTYSGTQVSAPITTTQVVPTRDPLTIGYWRNHPSAWTTELLARIQATDTRFDGADGTSPDGRLATSEVAAVLAPPGGMPRVTRQQLLATYFNLASRRVNAATLISSKTASQLGLGNIRQAGKYAQATLDLPVSGNQDRYGRTTTVLDEINQGKSEKY